MGGTTREDSGVGASVELLLSCVDPLRTGASKALSIIVFGSSESSITLPEGAVSGASCVRLWVDGRKPCVVSKPDISPSRYSGKSSKLLGFATTK
jgi:hypothetical protein